jgi:lipopolysaccharide exporter
MQGIGFKKIAGSSLWLTASFALAKISQLVAQIFLARLLSPSDFGVWGMVTIVTNLSALFKDAAIAGVLVHRGLEDKKLVNAVYSLGVNISLLMCVLQALIGFPLANFFRVPELLPLTAIVALVFLIGAGAGSHGAILQRQMKFRELAIIDAVVSFTRFGSATVCAVSGLGVWSFAFAEVAMTLVDALLKRIYSGYQFTYHPFPDAAVVKEVRGYISSLVGINLAVYANTNGDNFIIGKLLGSQQLGYYNLAYQLAMLPTFALSQVNRINFSVLSQQDSENQKVYVTKSLKIYALLSAPVYGVAFVIAPWIIPLVYGQKWVAAVTLFQIILVFAYARGFMSILGTTLNAINKPNINAAINWVLVPLSLPAFWLGAKFGGVLGVAIASAIVMGVAATIWFWFATCKAANWQIVDLAKPTILPSITLFSAVTLVSFIQVPLYLKLLLFIIFYLVSLYVFSGHEIIYKVQSMLRKNIIK